MVCSCHLVYDEIVLWWQITQCEKRPAGIKSQFPVSCDKTLLKHQVTPSMSCTPLHIPELHVSLEQSIFSKEQNKGTNTLHSVALNATQQRGFQAASLSITEASEGVIQFSPTSPK